MRWEHAEAAIAALFEHRGSATTVHINFFGGEPLLAWPLIVRVVAAVKVRAEQEGVRAVFTMTTNATRVTPERAAFLALNAFTVLVSIDGTQQDHDAARPDASGRGSWERVVKGARMLISELGDHRVAARATLRAGHSSYDEMERVLIAVGFREVHLIVEDVHPSRAATHAIPASDWNRRVTHANDVAAAYRPLDFVFRGRQSGSDPIREIVQLLINGQTLPRPCGVGGSAAAVSTSGTVFPCHRFVGDVRFALGSVRNNRPSEVGSGPAKFAAAYAHVQSSCEGCSARQFCAGGCLHVAVGRMDHGLSPHDEQECETVRATVIAAIHALVRHVDLKAVEVPRLLDRRLLNAACKAEFFAAQRIWPKNALTGV